MQKPFSLSLLALPMAALLVHAAYAQDASGLPPLEERPATVFEESKDEILTFAIENDRYGSGSDSYYTNGARLSYLNASDDAPAFAQWVSDKIPMFQGAAMKGYTLSVGQNMYTPEDISIAAPQPNDRPYAGFTYASMGMAAGDPANVVNELELTLGVVGPLSYAEQTQTFVHHLRDYPKPQGWANQLRNEPVLNLGWMRSWNNVWNQPIGFSELSFVPNVSAALGNAYTHAGVGGTLRWSSDPAAMVDNPVRVRPAMPGTGYFKATAHPNLVLFTGAEQRLIGRNIFLDGNTFEDSASVEKRMFVTDLQAGAVVTWKNYQVGYTAVYRTPEFFGQDNGTIFGALSFAYRF